MDEVEWDKYGREVLGPKDETKRFIGGKSGAVWGCGGRKKSWRV
jgi:hypothetical protein